VARANQNGSILGFVVVGGILALLVIGGAYVVRHSLASTSERTPTPAQEGTNTEGDSAQAPVDDSSSSTENDESTDESVSLPGGTEDDTVSSEGDGEVPDGLPQTGPANIVAGSIMFGSLVGASVAYKRSRRLLTSL
jgi:hypothetical protein